MPQLTELANLPPAPCVRRPKFDRCNWLTAQESKRCRFREFYHQTDTPHVGGRISNPHQDLNAFGLTNLPVIAVTVALPANDTAGIHRIQPSTIQKLTFSGKDSISIRALAVSDPLNFRSKAQSTLTVTMYLQSGQTTNSITSHPGSPTTSWWQYDNAVSAPSLTITNSAIQSAAHWYFVSAIEAWAPPSYGTFAIIGDSITDGRGSNTNKNNRWSDLLLARLQKDSVTKRIGIANQAAGGNRTKCSSISKSKLVRVDVEP